MRDSFISALTELAEADPMVTLITGDLGFGVLTDFAKRFPKQFINAGVAEQQMTGMACGMALEGHKVYTYSIGNFTILRPLEQIRNDICYHDCDVTVVSVGGGFSYGQLGVSHFATEDLAILRTIPNMTVVAPSDPWETAILTHQMAAVSGPKYLRLDKGAAGLPETPADVQLGKARIVREGKDLTLIAIGAIASEAIAAADALQQRGIECRVMLLNCIKPLDAEAILAAAGETGGIITVEEHVKIGGLGSAVSECCMTNGVFPKVFKMVGLEDSFPTIVGDQNYLRQAYSLDAKAIASVALDAANKDQD